MSKDRTGEKYLTNEGYEIEIIEWFGCYNCTVKFNDKNSTIKKNIIYGSCKSGNITNPNHPALFGIGYVGQGKYKTKEAGKTTKQYNIWSAMFQRCYDIKVHESHPTYIGCSVDERWHNFQNFAKWFDENYIEGWELDKDILVKNNKVYSFKNCCFVPSEINNLFKESRPLSGVFKSGNKFVARLGINGKKFYIGTFDTKELAKYNFELAKYNRILYLAEKYKKQLALKVYKKLITIKK